MTFNDLLKKYKGKLFYGKKAGIVPVDKTVYGAVIEKFEGDKYDIQLTCFGSAQLQSLLDKLTADVHD